MNQNSGFFSSIPVVTRNLIIINLLIWFAEFLLLSKFNFIDYLGLHYFLSDKFMPHQLITYMFVHDPNGIMHVFFNMFAVFMFGRTLETVWGPKKFLTYYILTGIGAAIAQELVYTIDLRELVFNSEIQNINIGTAIINRTEFFNYLPPTIGASGAVFGILLAFGMLFPNAELFIIPFPFPIKAKWFVLGYGLIELFLGVSNNAADNVAHFAHLGGLVAGLIIMLYWRQKAKKNGRFY